MSVGTFSLPGLLRGQILNVLRKLFQGDKEEALPVTWQPLPGRGGGRLDALGRACQELLLVRYLT